MKKVIISLFVIFAVGVTVVNLMSCPALAEQRAQKDRYTYLVCGFDDAAQNTDAIMLFSYSMSNNSADFIQIPRDTYYNFKGERIKINQLFPKAISEGRSTAEAMARLKREINAAFNINIDGYVGYTVDAFARMINNIGGVDLELNEDFVYTDDRGKTISLKAGKNHLSGEDAVSFVRYRKGYATGDLGRIDAQKLFLSSLVESFKQSINIVSGIKMMCDSGEGVVTDLNVGDIINLAIKNLGRIPTAKARYTNIPGGGVMIDGVSYYVASRAACVKLFTELGGFDEFIFDKNGGLYPSIGGEPQNIYNSKTIGCVIYDDSNFSTLRIKGK